MQACRIEIATTADDQRTEFIKDGYCELSLQSATLRYDENGARVTLALENGVVTIRRTGDYSLSLVLKRNEVCAGTLGINGYEGSVQTKTTKLAYSLSEKSFLLSLHYALIIGAETQNMKLRIFVKVNT